LKIKRYGLTVVVLGIAAILLALAPQLRADGTDHFNDGYAMASRSTSTHDSDLIHADAWTSDGTWNTSRAMCSGMGNNGDGNTGSTGTGSSGNTGSSGGGTTTGGSGTTSASTPEPSSLFLLLTAFAAVAVGLALKKAA
jgi:uncharacterized membrane protein YgcG